MRKGMGAALGSVALAALMTACATGAGSTADQIAELSPSPTEAVRATLEARPTLQPTPTPDPTAAP
ncbi:MAG TPA: hypothetical protein VJQ09_03310, partial [Candidatus Limnocylindria bacterium]|nr:hypothetical protein [Candidatus Limnocylindria bacterium]